MVLRDIEVPQARDVGEQWGILYLKYNNGRFFVNMEYDYDRVTERRSGALPLTSISRNQAFPTLDTQHDSGAIEIGALWGPAKATVIGAWFRGRLSLHSALLGAKPRPCSRWRSIQDYV